ncbi:hypothetical protein BV898_10365 [Hypsibius exemplaris]|uniref:Uncharacterized protein n=1 Tax=Hypsibius exemplaris TaxID=2072580 RepID=A0A1W0WJU9_HYPEX|nr:hypothetical protein BV898_10365 [Hypsibius exemplaris]
MLNLRSNRITALPDEVCRMSELRVLDISGNRFQTFPSFILNNSKIQTVIVQDNQIIEVDTDLLKGASLSLKELNLCENPLSRHCHSQLEYIREEGGFTFCLAYSPAEDNFADID